MIRRIPESVAVNALLVLFSLTITFHLLVITGIIPHDIVWGGRLNTVSEMRRAETVSIILNILMLTIVALRSGKLSFRTNPKIIRVLLWFMTGLFILNTAGNLLSANEKEKLIFTPITLLLSLLCLRLAMSSEKRAM
jgi:CDP-diglyceride synthetase